MNTQIKALEEQIKLGLAKNPDSEETLVLISKWFWLTEKKNRMTNRFIQSFVNKHGSETPEEFERWLTR